MGKAHVVRKRTVTVEEHFDDCGEDLSSLKGIDTCSVAWATELDDAFPKLTDESHSLICDGLERTMFYNASHSQSSSVCHNALCEVPQIPSGQCACTEIAEFREMSPQTAMLTVRRSIDNHKVLYFAARIDLQHTPCEMETYLASHNVQVMVFAPKYCSSSAVSLLVGTMETARLTDMVSVACTSATEQLTTLHCLSISAIQ